MDQVWDERLLSGSTIKTLKRLKFTKMTPKQAAAIPLFLQRKDFAAEAVTEVELAKEFLIQKNRQTGIVCFKSCVLGKVSSKVEFPTL